MWKFLGETICGVLKILDVLSDMDHMVQDLVKRQICKWYAKRHFAATCASLEHP